MDKPSGTAMRILIVEDDMIDGQQLRRLLSRSSLSVDQVEVVDCLNQAMTTLADHEFDIVLLDLNLPDSSGLNTLIAAEKACPHTTKIVITGQGSEELGSQAVAQGAQDYLVKGEFDADALTRAVRYSFERKKSEEALRESRSKLNAMLESLSDPTIMVDRTLTIIWSNQANKQSFGEDAVGFKCHKFYHDTDEPCGPEPCMVVKALQDGHTHSCEMQMVDGEGHERYFHWTANAALRDTEGNPMTVIAVGRDITHRKTAEENIRAAYAEVERANHELREMQSQLVQSEKLASIGQLAAGVAHEMNTPVGFVACNFETLEDYLKKILSVLDMYDALARSVEASDKEHRLKTLEEIKTAKKQMQFDHILTDLKGLFEDSREGLDRVTNIIQNLRDFSRIDQTSDIAEYNINEGIKTTLIVARNEIKYDAEVRTEFGDIRPVFCNAGQINQVFLNILVNAVQAIRSLSRETPGSITIRTYQTETSVVCEIEDDGPGIPSDVLPRIFDPFFTTKPPGKGTGLGLSVSYDIIVNKHKGQILADNQKDRGARFTIMLPLVRPQITDTPAEAY